MTTGGSNMNIRGNLWMRTSTLTRTPLFSHMFCCQTLLAGPLSVAGAPWQVPPPTAPPGVGSSSLVVSLLLCVEVVVVCLLEVDDTHGPGLSHPGPR